MSESSGYGKGDRQRKVDIKKFHDNWDKIFNKNVKEKLQSQENLNPESKSSKKTDSN